MKMKIIAAAVLTLFSTTVLADEDGMCCSGAANGYSTPSYGDIAYGIGYELWSMVRGLDGGYSGSGNSQCNCSVGGSNRAR